MQRGSAWCHTFATKLVQGLPRYHETRLGELSPPLVLRIDTTSTRFQLRFVAPGLSMEFAVHLASEAVVKLRWQDANGTKAVVESLGSETCKKHVEWIPTRWSFTRRTVEIDVCGDSTKYIQNEVPIVEATTPFTLLVGSEAEAFWSVCLD